MNSRRGASPVIGVILMITITILLASLIGIFALEYTNFLNEPSPADEPDKSKKLVVPDEKSPNTTTPYRVYYQVDIGSDTAGNSLNGIRITFENGGTDFSNATSSGDITEVGFDTDNDQDVDRSVKDDLSSVNQSNGGNTIELGFIGNYNISSGDDLVIRFKDSVNPPSGTYDVEVGINGDVTKADSVTFS